MALFDTFLVNFITNLVKFTLYLAITMKKSNLKRIIKRRRTIIFFWIIVDKGEGREGLRMWIKIPHTGDKAYPD